MIDRELLCRALSLELPRSPIPLPREAAPAAVLVPITRQREPRVIMHVRAHSMTEHAGEVAFAGGRPDPADHDLSATALREADEELGLAPPHVELLGPLAPVPVITGRYLVHPFVALVDDGVAHARTGEIERLVLVPFMHWVTGAEKVPASVNTWRGSTFTTPHFRLDSGDVLYGASAAIFYELLARLALASGLDAPSFVLEDAPPWGDRYRAAMR